MVCHYLEWYWPGTVHPFQWQSFSLGLFYFYSWCSLFFTLYSYLSAASYVDLCICFCGWTYVHVDLCIWFCGWTYVLCCSFKKHPQHIQLKISLFIYLNLIPKQIKQKLMSFILHNLQRESSVLSLIPVDRSSKF